MRNPRSWKSDLMNRLGSHAANPDVLCDVELALTLVSEVCPSEPPSVVPALLSANPVGGLSSSVLSERHCGLIARARTLLRCRGEMRWQSMLRSYNSESELVRMYDTQRRRACDSQGVLNLPGQARHLHLGPQLTSPTFKPDPCGG